MSLFPSELGSIRYKPGEATKAGTWDPDRREIFEVVNWRMVRREDRHGYEQEFGLDSRGRVIAFASRVACTECGEWVYEHYELLRWTPSNKPFCEPCHIKIEASGFSRIKPLAVPPEFIEWASLDVHPTARRQRLAKFPQKQLFLGLFGTPGTGKTATVWALHKHVYASAKYLDVRDCVKVRTDWANLEPGAAREKFVVYLERCPLLALDDLSKAVASDGWAETVCRVLDERIAQHRPTVVTSMDTGKTLAGLYGSHFASRLNRFEWIDMGKKDLRVARNEPN